MHTTYISLSAPSHTGESGTLSNPDRTQRAEIHSILKRLFTYGILGLPRHHGRGHPRTGGSNRGFTGGRGGAAPKEVRRERGGGEEGKAAAPETPNPARARQRLCPRVASAPGTAAPRRLQPLARHPQRPPGPRRTRPFPHPADARSNPNAQHRRALPNSAQSTRQAEVKSLRLAAPLRSAQRLPHSQPALTAPRSRCPALAPTPPGRRSAPPPSCSRPRGGATRWRRGGRRERRWRRRSRGAARISC